MKNYKRIIIISGILLIFLAVFSGLYLFNKEHPDLKSVKADYTFSSEQLINEIEAEELNATEKYMDKVLEVSGPVSHTDRAEDGTLTVTLMNENQFAGVICTFSKQDGKTVNPVPGDKIIIRGIFSGVLMDVLLNNCVIIEEKNL